MKKAITALAIMALLGNTYGQKEEKAFMAIEIDPAPFILGGYSFSFKYQRAEHSRISYMASIFAADFPDAMMTSENKDKGWKDMKIGTSYAAFMDYHFGQEGRGFHLGPAVFYYQRSVALESQTERVRFNTLYPNVRLGYTWFPFKNTCFYLDPWVNLGSEFALGKGNTADGTTFKPNSFNYIVALHFGYRFSRCSRGK